jgi:hypothetical protein
MRRSEFIWFCITALMLCAVIPTWMWLALPDRSGFNLNALLALTLAEYCGLRLAVLAAFRHPMLLATTFYVFVYVWGGIAAFAQTYSGIFPWVIRHTPDDATRGLVEIGLAVAAYEIGMLVANRRDQLNLRLPPTPMFVFNRRQIVMLSLAALPLMLIGMYMLGGTGVLFKPRGGYDQAVGAAVGSTLESVTGSALLQVPAFIAFVLLCLYGWQSWPQLKLHNRRLFAVLLAYVGLIFYVSNYPASLPRQWLGTIALTPLLMLLPWHRQWAIGSVGVGLVALILLVFPYADAYRRYTDTTEDALSRALEASVVDNVLNKGDFDVYQQTLNGLVVTDQRGHDYGRNFLGAVLFWFPRQFWPDKPISTGTIVASAVGYPWHQTKLSAPLWMEAHWAFGWIGVALILGLYGYFSRWLDLNYAHAILHRGSNSILLAVVPFFAAYQFIFVRGDLLHGTSRLVFVLFFFMFACWPWRRAAEPATLRLSGAGR